MKKGVSTAHARLEPAGGAVIEAGFTEEAIDELGLGAGEQAFVVVTSCDVMLAKTRRRAIAIRPSDTVRQGGQLAGGALAPADIGILANIATVRPRLTGSIGQC